MQTSRMDFSFFQTSSPPHQPRSGGLCKKPVRAVHVKSAHYFFAARPTHQAFEVRTCLALGVYTGQASSSIFFFDHFLTHVDHLQLEEA